MSLLDAFVGDRTQGERVIGTYLYPLGLFGEPDWKESYSCTEVVRHVAIDPCEVLVTRMGGLFVQPPQELADPYGARYDSEAPMSDLEAKMAFEETTAEVFNLLICELALLGVVSEPASPVHINYGRLIDNHALVVAGSGAREMYLDRSIGPSLALLANHWIGWPIHGESLLDEVAGLARTRILAAMSATLPSLVPGAYYHYSRRQPAEALMDAWIVTEQILDSMWTEYTDAVKDGKRKQRLADSQTYSASVRIEVLHTAGVIDRDMYEDLHEARDARNRLAHRALIDLNAASQGMCAMRCLIELVCGTSVAHTDVSMGVNW